MVIKINNSVNRYIKVDNYIIILVGKFYNYKTLTLTNDLKMIDLKSNYE